MRKKKLLSICICVITTALIIGVSGCNKKSDESNISESVEHTAANEPSNDVEQKSNDTEKTSNYETISTPYIIDTVANADIIDIYSYSQDKEDNIYYIDNNCIYKVNAYGGTANKVLDAKDVIVDNEEMTLSKFSIVSIAYNDNANKLFMTGKYNSVNSAKNVSNYYLYSITNSSAEVITDTLKEGTELIKILNNGDCFIKDSHDSPDILNGQTYEEKGFNGPLPCDIYDNDTELYIITQYGMRKYNFIETTDEWNTDILFNSEGINNECVAIAREDTIELCNFKGKALETINSENATILDRTKVNTSAFEEKLLLTSKNDIVFYDKTAKAFRIIKKNDTTVGLSADDTQ